jgi:hypothetical protein
MDTFGCVGIEAIADTMMYAVFGAAQAREVGLGIVRAGAIR